MSIKITIEGDGLKYESNTTMFLAGQVISFLNKAAVTEEGIVNPEGPTMLLNSDIKQASQDFNISPREALIKYNAKTNTQKILTFAYYALKKYDNITFDQAIIKSLFKKAGESEPGNFSRDWSDGVKLNYYYETDQPGQFEITEFGKEVLESSFKTSTEKSKARSKAKQSNTGSNKQPIKQVTEAIKQIDLVSPNLEGYPNYWKINVKGIRLLWILVFAESHGISELTTTDIEFLANKLKDSIPPSNFSGLSKQLFKSGYITRNSKGLIKLLQPGIDYLKGYKLEDEK